MLFDGVALAPAAEPPMKRARWLARIADEDARGGVEYTARWKSNPAADAGAAGVLVYNSKMQPFAFAAEHAPETPIDLARFEILGLPPDALPPPVVPPTGELPGRLEQVLAIVARAKPKKPLELLSAPAVSVICSQANGSHRDNAVFWNFQLGAHSDADREFLVRRLLEEMAVISPALKDTLTHYVTRVG